jgi:Ran GTPase-activating protein 1
VLSYYLLLVNFCLPSLLCGKVSLAMAPPKVFSLEGQGLKLVTPADIEAYLKPLLEDHTFTEIRLSGNTFSVQACERLARALTVQKILQVANLSNIFSTSSLSETPPALTFILNALLEIPTLHTVNLSSNEFGPYVVAPLGDFLSRHVPLRHLILNDNGLGPRAGTIIADALTTLAKRKEEARKTASDGVEIPLLETVACGQNRLGSNGMEAWARAYRAHGSSIRSVKMIQNAIMPEGISILLNEGLSHASGIEVLDLQDNAFWIPGSGALASAIQGWPSLRELGVGDCSLSAHGGIRLAKALSQGNNQKVETLRLKGNDITAEGVEQFLHAARDTLPALRRIELNRNRFVEDDDNVESLRELLKKRKEVHSKEDDLEDMWGVDELDELQEEAEDEEEDDDEGEDEAEVEDHKVVKNSESSRRIRGRKHSAASEGRRPACLDSQYLDYKPV